MYRFADKALVDQSFSGGKPLEEFLRELFGGSMPDTNNQIRFIDHVREQFKKYTNLPYVDTFTIERENNSFFCLFFFTNNKTGYHKMLDAKWTFDEQSGRAFEINDNPMQTAMFDAVSEVDYVSEVEAYLKQVKICTNQDLFDFGLEKGFLAKHTKKVLDTLKDKLVIEAMDGEPVKRYYIDDKHIRKISFKLK